MPADEFVQTLTPNRPCPYDGARAEVLWPADVVEILGLKSLDSLRATAGRSRKLAALGQLTEHDLPVPDGRDRHPVPGGPAGTVIAVQSWWWRGTIEDHLPHRRKRGNPGKAATDGA